MRRVVDVLAALAAAVALSPVMAAVAGVVRSTLGRPVLFRQRRVGLGGREFDIVKFRTMRPEAFPGEPDIARDTAVGRLIRGTSMDELPQLWNVLRGDMSVIGPRPTLPEQVRHYSARQHGRHAVRPGLTGWAQINGRNSISWPERIEMDLWYIGHRSLGLDLRILFRTVLKVLRPSGIYGEAGVNLGFPLPDTAYAAPTTTETASTTEGKSST